jgi:putative hydrolase of the HAD superfamily
MIELITQLKHRHRLKIVVVSNESRAVNAQRILTFKLAQLADTFISSCFVRMRKPDVDIFVSPLTSRRHRLSRSPLSANTAMFVKIAEGFGMRCIVDHTSTRTKLASLGLRRDGGASTTPNKQREPAMTE